MPLPLSPGLCFMLPIPRPGRVTDPPPAEAPLAGPSGRPSVRYPEPDYEVELAYPELQTGPSPSSTLASQDSYQNVWCVYCDGRDAVGFFLRGAG